MTMLRHLGRLDQRYHLERRERIGMLKSLIVSAIAPGSHIHLWRALVEEQSPTDLHSAKVLPISSVLFLLLLLLLFPRLILNRKVYRLSTLSGL